MIILISGGGSSLLCKSRVPLKDLQFSTDLLLKSGADINEINTIRKHLSFVKGGQLVKNCKSKIISLIISDIVGENGFIFAVEAAPRVARQLVYLTEERKNIAPLLMDANKPEQYLAFVTEVDFLYQDIAQKNQVEIFLKNLMFLKKGGYGVLCIKARSIDVTRNPSFIFKEV